MRNQLLATCGVTGLAYRSGRAAALETGRLTRQEANPYRRETPNYVAFERGWLSTLN